MKSVHEALDQILPEIIAMSEDIYCHPELGFKEFRTRKKAIEALDKAGIPHEDVAYTGIRAVLDSGKPGPNIGLITEFDAVPTFGHPYASEDSCAAHTCGHYGQLGVMMSLFLAIKDSGMLKDLCGKVTLLVTPAEEFCDMDYRKELIKEGKISHPSGKQEMIATGIFAHIALQVTLNIGVVTGLLPTTGVTLPFISYGGTAIVILLAEMGIALGISSKIRLK